MPSTYGDIIVNQFIWDYLPSANALHWLNWLERELDNIRATLIWCIANPAGYRIGSRDHLDSDVVLVPPRLL